MSGRRIEGRHFVIPGKTATEGWACSFSHSAINNSRLSVLADRAQTCQPSTEELLPADNYHREQSTVRQAAIAAAISYLRAVSGATEGSALLERVRERAGNTFDEFVDASKL